MKIKRKRKGITQERQTGRQKKEKRPKQRYTEKTNRRNGRKEERKRPKQR